jgi:hypothetical protein
MAAQRLGGDSVGHVREQVAVSPVAGARRARADGGAQQPSSARQPRSRDEPTCPTPATSTTAAGASDAVRELLALVKRVVTPRSDEVLGARFDRATTHGRAPPERVARLRDELHVTANRVARFAVAEHPVVDPVRITAPTAASSALGAEQLTVQLEVTAGRLIDLLGRLSPGDWSRTCRTGGRLVTLGELVDRVLDGATSDLLDLSPAGSERAGPSSQGRSRHDECDARPGARQLRRSP